MDYLEGVVDGHGAAINLCEAFLESLKEQQKTFEAQHEHVKKTGKVDKTIGIKDEVK